MAQETFFNYRNYRWLKAHLVLLAVMIAIYLWDRPIGGRNGGTWLGYSYGIFAALAIVYLMWFGIRKRSYYSNASTVKGWLAVHVWLGLALIVIVPLHSGFSFGWNVHTLAYALMVLTVVSGLWGSTLYRDLAPEVGSHRGGGTAKQLLDQLYLLSREIENLMKSKSDAFVSVLTKADINYKPGLMNSLFSNPPAVVDKAKIAALLIDLKQEEREDGLKLVSLIDKKQELCAMLHKEVRVQALLKAWLYLHVPISFGLIVALAIHIISVFYLR